MINIIEPALDCVFASRADQQAGYDHLHRHLIRRHHGSKQRVIVDPGRAGTRYDAGRWAPNSLVVYAQPFSRVSGETDVVHLEWRASGLKAVRAAGIRSAADLLRFDHREFWEKRLVLADIDEAELGKLKRNAILGTRRKTLEDQDRRMGRIMVIQVLRDDGSETVQDVIDRFRGEVRLERIIRRLDIQDWLPPREEGVGSISHPEQSREVEWDRGEEEDNNVGGSAS